MEHLAKLLLLKDIHIFEELRNSFVCNLNKDKVLVITKISSLEEVQELVYTLPSLREKLRKKIENIENTIEVADIYLSKFLWDMYVIGLHQIELDEEKFNEIEVAKLQRNRFVARKIIIEYENEEELKKKFDQLVLPERALNELLGTYVNEEFEYQAREIEELLTRVKEITMDN
ncbi:ABC-three component system middle component 1 [Paenibacillus sp. Mc5Re-14]|uniref:ABC-three component system middle component 1 n=1 Tax=Paenibacillus sp. Mc5Re-14 TaxID=1030529 RepID=UPI000B09D88B|nr:ABC-three component system middle component 1 [Paenibacillus sp. Mc5Re-14]